MAIFRVIFEINPFNKNLNALARIPTNCATFQRLFMRTVHVKNKIGSDFVKLISS